VNVPTHPHAPEANVGAALQDMMRRLHDPHASIQSLLPHLGHVEERQEGAGYDVAPLDKHFEHIFLGLYPSDWQPVTHAGAPKGEAPYYIEVTLRAGTRLHLADLGGAFGTWRHGTPAPEGNPLVVLFEHPDRHEPASPYEMRVEAFLSGEAGKAQSQIRQVTITREKKV